LSTNTVLPVILQVHLLRGGQVVAAAQPATGQAVVVMGVIHVEMIYVEGDVFLLLTRLVPVQAVLEAAGGQQENQEYTQGTSAHGHVQQGHAEVVRAVGLLLVKARGAMTHPVAPQDRTDARLDLWASRITRE